ncbi:hypothetical protein EV182_003488 [Spiromyces aspiralis]|uniref:Uncharacterized protein n=1 Tax=Spiromyces aspiralis TaxID=68401 RepID=A0ACC1HG45_9FUNG|nr:hypothetical protein EV182_003488 [Spiromyces aspiralis]
MRIFKFIFTKRNWAQDKAIFEHHMDVVAKSEYPTLLLIFPEGTTISKASLEKRVEFAQKTGLKEPTNVLFPRPTGLHHCLTSLHSGTITHIYDVTIGYQGLKKGQIPEIEYGLVNMFAWGIYPRQVHMHIRRFEVKNIPLDKPEFDQWLRERFYEKDRLMDTFYETGRFVALSPMVTDDGKRKARPRFGDESTVGEIVDVRAKAVPLELLVIWAVLALGAWWLVLPFMYNRVFSSLACVVF